MAISLYFGLPGAGKTTMASQICVDEAYKIKMGQSRYKIVITNAPITCEGVYVVDDFSWLGDYYVPDALIVVDEATLLWDSRNYKMFASGLVKGFVLHRHTRNDMVIFVQIWNRLDKTIRDICDRVYYMHKGAFCKKVSYANRIPYKILFPDNGDNVGDIVMGYQKCSIMQRIFSKRIWRPYYYPYFNTYWIPEDMKLLPQRALKEFWKDKSAPPYPLYPKDRFDRFTERCERINKIIKRRK